MIKNTARSKGERILLQKHGVNPFSYFFKKKVLRNQAIIDILHIMEGFGGKGLLRLQVEVCIDVSVLAFVVVCFSLL